MGLGAARGSAEGSGARRERLPDFAWASKRGRAVSAGGKIALAASAFAMGASGRVCGVRADGSAADAVLRRRDDDGAE